MQTHVIDFKCAEPLPNKFITRGVCKVTRYRLPKNYSTLSEALGASEANERGEFSERTKIKRYVKKQRKWGSR